MATAATKQPKIGTPTTRIDGRPKVTDEALYASDMALANPAHAFLVTSAIALGRITAIDENETRALPGVLDILTHANVRCYGASVGNDTLVSRCSASTTKRPTATSRLARTAQRAFSAACAARKLATIIISPGRI
jgi:CO/xanthine dehydrogenase Mo-binding subunit